MLNFYISISKYRIFTISIVLLLSLLMGFHFIYFEYFSKKTLQNDMETRNFKYIEKNGSSIKFASIGTSHTGDALKINDNSYYNYGGSDGWYPQVMYAKFVHLLKNAPNLKVLFLEVDHISILTYDYKIHNEMPKQYLYLLQHVDETLDETIKLKENENNLYFISMRENVAPVIHRKFIQNYLVNSGKKDIESQWSVKTEIEKMNSAKKRIESYKLNYTLSMDKLVIQYFNKVIEESKKHDIQLYLVFYPQTKEYLSQINETNNLLVEDFVTSLSKKENLILLDYRNIFKEHSEYFANQDHLNDIGAKHFTNKLILDLDRGLK